MLRRHLQTNAVGYLALTVALGGTSYAATALPRASVGAVQLKKNSVTTAKVKNGSLLAQDFKTGQLPAGSAGKDGTAGPIGLTGDRGPVGAAGDQGATGTQGLPGVQGPVGPTYANQVNYAGTAPSVVPDTTLDTSSLALPSGGRVYVYGHVTTNILCSAGTEVQLGAYLDAVPVPGTGRGFTTGSSFTFDFTGLSAPVAAGTRSLTLRVDCVSGTASGGSVSNVALGGILIGS